MAMADAIVMLRLRWQEVIPGEVSQLISGGGRRRPWREQRGRGIDCLFQRPQIHADTHLKEGEGTGLHELNLYAWAFVKV